MTPFKRIRILTQYYLPEQGAAQVRLSAVALALQRRGIEVDVVTAMPNYPTGKIFKEYRHHLQHQEYIAGIPVRRVWLYPAAGRSVARRLLNYASFNLTSALPLLTAPKSDLILVEAQPMTLAFSALCAGMLSQTPYVYNVPDLQVEVARAKWGIGETALNAAQRLEDFLARRALCVSTVTYDFMRHFQARLPASPVTYLPNGVDTAQMAPQDYCHEWARRLGFEGKRIFVYAGTLYQHCGLEILIEAVARIHPSLGVRLLIAGDGPLKETLMKLCAQRGLNRIVQFSSFTSRDVPALMSIADASLAPTHQGEVGLHMRLAKVLPSLSCGAPVITVGESESARMIRAFECGMAIPDFDAQALAEAMSQLAKSPQRRAQMAHNGRALAIKHFDWSHLVENWLEQLSCVVRGERPAIQALF